MTQALKLSAAILAGCKIAPRKCQNVYFIGLDSCCIVAAAAVGSGLDPEGGRTKNVLVHLLKNFPQTFEDRKNGMFNLTVREAMRRNDTTDESRESIAAWLAEHGL